MKITKKEPKKHELNKPLPPTPYATTDTHHHHHAHTYSSGQKMPSINVTEGLGGGVETPGGRLVRIEIYVVATAVILTFLLIFGSFRRRCHYEFLKFLIWTSYILSTYLISYTMGLMQSAPFRNELFAVWAMFLVIVLGSVDSMTAYSLEDNERRQRYFWEVLVQSFWLGWLIGMYDNQTQFKVPLFLLFVLSTLKTGERLEAHESASISHGLSRNAKLIADFMVYEHELSNQDEIDPVQMKGYNYLVRGEKKAMESGSVTVNPPLYQRRFPITDDEIITIHKISECKGRLLCSSSGSGERLKDICLSFAFFKLLCRRFAGYPLSECSHDKTWNLIRYGLLSGGENDYERAFRVIEVELAFLFDFFYTKYPVILDSTRFVYFKVIEVAVVIFSCWMAASTLIDYRSSPGDMNLVTAGGHNIDALVTGIVILAILFVEIVQLVLLIFSDWAKVLWLCKYVQKQSWQASNSTAEKMIEFVCNIRWLKRPWERKIGQYSLLESFHYNPSKLAYNYYVANLIGKPRNGQKESGHIKLHPQVKKAVIVSLRINGRTLRNGETSLQRNRLVLENNDLSWACRLETEIHVIMVWHIATSLCEIQTSRSNHEREVHFIVATGLSKYCAYLMVFAPRLLPGHAFVAENIFDEIVKEAREVLEGCKSMDSRYEKMMTLGEPGATTAIERGAVLGRQLIQGIQDTEQRWKVLADFWAEFMLFLAPSDDATAHAEHLAEGGEFVTHLWALLSHAGILNRDHVSEDVSGGRAYPTEAAAEDVSGGRAYPSKTATEDVSAAEDVSGGRAYPTEAAAEDV